MLECNVDLKKIALPCGDCNKCLGKSKLDYPFDRDLFDSDDFVQALMSFVNKETGCKCKPTEIYKNPDINVFDKDDRLICRIEAKYLEGQAFMRSKKYTTLYPREALAVDEPKLKSYIACKASDRAEGNEIPIFVAWKLDRPCDDIGGITVFQEIDTLQQIYLKAGSARAFERQASRGDFTNGSRLGITKKYHFSLRECEPIEKLPALIKALKKK